MTTGNRTRAMARSDRARLSHGLHVLPLLAGCGSLAVLAALPRPATSQTERRPGCTGVDAVEAAPGAPAAPAKREHQSLPAGRPRGSTLT